MKRIVCVILSLMLALACTGSLAANYSSEPEKLMLQFTKGSGLKGTLELNTSGSADWATLLSPLNGVTFSIRALDPGKGSFQYRLYVENGDDTAAMTEIIGDGTTACVTSDFLMGMTYSFPASHGLFSGLFDLSNGSTNWFTVLSNLLTIRSTSWTNEWEPALEPYEDALESLLEPYMTSEQLTDGGETRLRYHYEIPAETIRAELKAVINALMNDSTLLTLLQGKANDSQISVYLNPDYAVWYEQLVEKLPMTGSVTLERTTNIRGETVGTLLDFPLSTNLYGLKEFTLEESDSAMTVYLIGETGSVSFSASADEEQNYSGFFRIVRDEGSCFSASYHLTCKRELYTDEKSRNHEDYTYSLTMENDLSHLDVLDESRSRYVSFDPVQADLTMALYSKNGDQNAVTASAALNLSTGDSTLAANLAIKMASPWKVPDLPEGERTDLTAMTAEERAAVLDDWFRNGLLQIGSLFPQTAAEATPTDAEAQ